MESLSNLKPILQTSHDMIDVHNKSSVMKKIV